MSTVISPGAPGSQPTVVNDSDSGHHDHDSLIVHEVLEGQRATSRNVLDITRDMHAIEGRSLLESAKNAAAGILESAKNTAATQVLVQTKADATTLALSMGFAGQAAAIAECCCEIKSAIRDQADKVIDRIDEIEDSRRAVELVDAKAEIAVLKASLK